MLKRVLGSALKGCIVEQGLGGRDPGTKAKFAVLCHLRFDSVEGLRTAAKGEHSLRLRDCRFRLISAATMIDGRLLLRSKRSSRRHFRPASASSPREE